MAKITKGTGVVKHVRTTITFDGTSGKGQAGTATTVFTATGRVLVHALTAFVTTNLGEALATATVSLGTSSWVTRFVATTNSVDLDANEWWVTSTPTNGSIDLPDALKGVLVSENIIVETATQDTNAGVVVFDCLYEAITDNGLLA